MKRGLATALLAVALAVAGRPASADGTADEADIHFKLGNERFRKGDYADALAHFLLSNRLVPNRNVVYNIAATYEQMKRYADAYRYYVDALAGEPDPKAKDDIRASMARIAPNVAVLDVETDPPGATIYVDRKDLGSLGVAPRLFALPPGRYKVIAELAGHEGATADTVDLTKGGKAKIKLALARIVGTVHVDAGDARGAAVRVDDPDGPTACVAPCDLSLTPGAHELFVTAEGRGQRSRRVDVPARGAVRIAVKLEPLAGSLAVETDERDAEVRVDGKPRGRTPALIGKLPVGRHEVEVRAPGYAPEVRQIEVRADEHARLFLELTPLREVIAVSRHAERADEAPSSVSILDGRELRAFGYPTIAEALRGVRGVTLSNDHAYTSIGVRGVGQPGDYGSRLLVLSDGQPLNDNLLNSSYVGSDGRVDLHDIDRIEVVRGPGSLLYGAGAFSGVVALVTRPRDEPTSVHVGVGSYDDAVIRARAGFHYNAGNDRGVWASVSAAHSIGSDLALSLKDTPRVPASASKVEAFDSIGTAGRAFWGPATMQWFFHTRTQSIPVGAYDTVFGDARTAFRDTRMMAELRYEPKVNRWLDVMARLHANRYEFHGVYQYDSGGNVEDYRGTWFGAETRLVFTPLKELRLTAGGEAQLHAQATLEGRSDESTYLDEHAPYRFAAAYAIADASPLRWLTLQGGARVDVYSTFGPIVVPRAAIIVKPPTGTVIKLMGGRAFRAPSIYEQVYNDGNVSEVRSVDPKRGYTLGPESVYSGELEVSQRFLTDWVALAAGHVSHVTGLIGTVDAEGCAPPPGETPSCTRFANTPSPVLIAGADVEIRREWRRGFMLGAMYGYQRAVILDKTLADPHLVNAPEHLASVRGVAPVVKDLLSFALRATLEAPRRISMDSEKRTEAGVVLDAAVSGDVKAAKLHYTVGVYNIAGWRNEVPVTATFRSATMPQLGRTFLVDVIAHYP